MHGDLKPENVLMSARGNVTLSDFGCSKVIISGNEYLERCNGTPAFLAPEMMKPHSRYRCAAVALYPHLLALNMTRGTASVAQEGLLFVISAAGVDAKARQSLCL